MRQVRERLVLLTHLVPSLSAWNVMDLPIWAWRAYAAMCDEYERQQREANRQ